MKKILLTSLFLIGTSSFVSAGFYGEEFGRSDEHYQKLNAKRRGTRSGIEEAKPGSIYIDCAWAKKNFMLRRAS
ncbi:MAG TPA: hypothetical protein VMW10_04380, partial [Alphaproteobacteria bacterium]|nr:hypothetical protein [Alphaproteobacteria bacterium]